MPSGACARVRRGPGRSVSKACRSRGEARPPPLRGDGIEPALSGRRLSSSRSSSESGASGQDETQPDGGDDRLHASVTPSLTMLRFRWKLTVCSEMSRILPIVQVLLPRAVQVRHSRSRSVTQIADGSDVWNRSPASMRTRTGR